MKLSIIIVAYYSRKLIGDCLQSVFTYNDLPDGELEVMVVENSPAGEAAAMQAFLEEHFGSKVRFIRNSFNRGYGSGNNEGIRQATGRVVAVMNPDIRLHEPLFGRAIARFEANPDVAMLGFRQLGNQNISFYLNPELYFPVLRSLAEQLTNRMKRFFPRYFFLSGAFLFFDRQKFWAAGGFDEHIFLYMEESDISRRIQHQGYSIQFLPECSYLHLIDDRIGFSADAYRHLLTSLSYYCRKYNFNERKVRKRMLMEVRLKKWVASLLHRAELAAVMERTAEVLLESPDL